MQSWKKTAQKHWFLPYTSHAHSSNLSSTLSSSRRLIVASFVCGEGRVMFLICRQIETRCRWVTNYENTNKSDDGNVFSPPNFAITSSTWYPWAPSHQWRMMAGSVFSVATVLQLREKTKFQRWEQNITEIKMMQMISHPETTLPFRRRCVERVRGVSFGGARLWKAWQPALCHCRHDAVKVSHQLCTFCFANKWKHKISPSYFRILSIEVFAICSWRWMICNSCFGSAVALMDLSGRHGRSIWIFVEISWEKREGVRGLARRRRRRRRECEGCHHLWPTVMRLSFLLRRNYAVTRKLRRILP